MMRTTWFRQGCVNQILLRTRLKQTVPFEPRTPQKPWFRKGPKKLKYLLFLFMKFERYSGIYYATFTVLYWQKIFANEKNISIILDTLSFLSKNKPIQIFGFVVMPNHIHLMYQTQEKFNDGIFNHSFKSFTSKEIFNSMHPDEKINFLVDKGDRKYQLWKSHSLSVDIFSP